MLDHIKDKPLLFHMNFLPWFDTQDADEMHFNSIKITTLFIYFLSL